MTAGLDDLPGGRAARHARRALLLAALLPLAAAARAQGAGGDTPVPAGIVGAFDALFGGPHPRRRAVHANGLVLEGRFTPAPGAAGLSRAPHLREPVPVLARFSNFAAVPGLPDGHPDASPRGLAVKFLLPGDEDTDIVAHSYDGAPAGTPEAFLDFLRAVPDPAALAALTAARPAARAFAEHPKPTPASYATEAYFGVSAFRFTNAEGLSRHGRTRILPVVGLSHLGAAEAAARPPGFLAEELRGRLARGPVLFRVVVQLAGEGDPITDGSLPWPADRPVAELGLLSLHALLPEEDPRLTDLSFVPTNLPAGIAPTADPMLTARTQAYRLSAERRTDGR